MMIIIICLHDDGFEMKAKYYGFNRFMFLTSVLSLQDVLLRNMFYFAGKRRARVVALINSYLRTISALRLVLKCRRFIVSNHSRIILFRFKNDFTREYNR